MVCPLHPMGRRGRFWGQPPMKIITADSGEEHEPHEPARRGRPQQQPACLPDQQDGADGDIKAAENKIVDELSEHAAPVG